MSELFLSFLKAFLLGGTLCGIGQILIDRTKLTPAKILVGYVVTGVMLGALGLYPILVQWAGAGASVPLTGFGNILAQGMKDAIDAKGIFGIFSGAFTAGAAGIGASLLFGYLVAVFFKPKDK